MVIQQFYEIVCSYREFMSFIQRIKQMPRYTKIGFFAPFIALFTIALAIILSPGFDWLTNALSDLGHYTRTDLGPYKLVGAIVFNSGLILTGVLLLLYAIWFFRWTKDIPTKIGVVPLIIALCFLIAIGVFSEDVGAAIIAGSSIHYWVSVGFFLTFPFAMWIVGVSWLRYPELRWFSVVSLLVPFISVFMWADYLNGTSIWQQAVPEIVTAFSAIVWLWIINLLQYQRKLDGIGIAATE